MVRTPGRIISVALSIAVLLAAAGPASAAPNRKTRAARAIGYIQSQQQGNGAIPAFSPIGSTADAALAATAAGAGSGMRKAALRYLKRQVRRGNVDTIGLQAKVVLAVVASGRKPRSFGDTNLVAALRKQIGTDGRVGVSGSFDQALVLLALQSAGVKKKLTRKAAGWLLRAQCPGGGWAYDAPYDPEVDDAACSSGEEDFFPADTNTTSYAVQALTFAGRTKWRQKKPGAFFKTARDEDRGGWGYSAQFSATDANSTALVLQAFVAMGKKPPAGGPGALRALQHVRCGAWAFDWLGDDRSGPNLGATIGAVPGLMRAPLPISGPKNIPEAPETPTCTS